MADICLRRALDQQSQDDDSGVAIRYDSGKAVGLGEEEAAGIGCCLSFSFSFSFA